MVSITKNKINYFSVAGWLIVTAIIVMVNIVANFVYVRLDLTKNNIYSLSPASKKTLGKLKDKIVIKAYFSQNVTPPYSTYRDYLKDLLVEYKNYSKGRVTYTFVPSSDEEKFLEEARSYGIPSLRFQEIRKDKYEVKEGVMGVVILFEDSNEVIPIVRGVESLEYDLTSRILKLTRDSKKTLGIATGYKINDVPSKNQEIKSSLEQQYDVVTVPLDEGSTIQPNIDGLVVIGPAEKLSEESMFALDQYFMSGKPIFAAVNGFTPNLERFTCEELKTGLEELITGYGVGFKPGMVIDASAQNIMIRQQQGFMSINTVVQYFFVPLIKDISKDSPMIKDLESIATPFVKALDFDAEKNKNLIFRPLAKSSERSWVKDVRDISPYSKLAPGSQEELKPQTVLASVEGSFKSYYAEKAPPEKYKNMQVIKESPKNRMLVSGSGFMFNEEMPIAETNITLYLNAIDWLLQDDALIGIRSKDIKFKPIGEVSNWARILFKNVNMFLMPLLFIAYGLIRWNMRKSYKLRIKQELSAKEL